jgi:DNA-binding transcriptional ArsR family regulator
MTRTDPPWEALRTFGEVMREGGLSGAARRLGLSQPTVGRHIDALEASLGVALFARPDADPGRARPRAARRGDDACGKRG